MKMHTLDVTRDVSISTSCPSHNKNEKTNYSIYSRTQHAAAAFGAQKFFDMPKLKMVNFTQKRFNKPIPIGSRAAPLRTTIESHVNTNNCKKRSSARPSQTT